MAPVDTKRDDNDDDGVDNYNNRNHENNCQVKLPS